MKSWINKNLKVSGCCILIETLIKNLFCAKIELILPPSSKIGNQLDIVTKHNEYTSLLGCCIKFSCNLTKWFSQLERYLSIHPLSPSLPLYTVLKNWQINEVHIRKLNWRQIFPINISTYILYPFDVNNQKSVWYKL